MAKPKYGETRTVDVSGTKQKQYWTGTSWKKVTGPIPPEKKSEPAKTTSSSSSSSSKSTSTSYKPGDVVGGVAVGTVKANQGGAGAVEWDGKSWSATSKPVTPQSNNLASMVAKPVEYAPGAVVSNALVSNPTGSKYGLQVTNENAPTPSTSYVGLSGDRASQAIAAGSSVTTPADPNLSKQAFINEYKQYQDNWNRLERDWLGNIKDQAAATYYTNAMNQAAAKLATVGMESQIEQARAQFAKDPKALDAFNKTLAERGGMIATGQSSQDEAVRAAISQGERWTNTNPLLRGLLEPLDNLVNGSPVAAAIAANGVGITAGAAAGAGNVAPGVSVHTGMGMPATPPPVAPDYTNAINKAAADNPSVTPKAHNGIHQINPQYPFTPTSNQVGPTRPGDVQLKDITAPVYPTPTGAPIPVTPPAGTPGVTSPSGTTGTPSGGTTPPAGQPTGTGTGNPPAPPGIDAATWAQVLGVLGSAGMSIVAGNQQAAAAGEAAGVQSATADRILAEQKRQFDAQQNNLKPWLEAGGRALTDLENFDQTYSPFKFEMTGPNADPSYTFRFNEGMKALEASAAAKGMLQSGNTLKAITDYGQGAASQEYTNAFNRYNTRRGENLNRVQSLAGVGQSAVQQSNSASQNYANNTSNVMAGQGNAQAQGMTDAASARTMGWMGAGNSVMSGLSNYYQNQQSTQMMNALMGMFRK